MKKFQVLFIAVILISFGFYAYTVFNTTKTANQERARALAVKNSKGEYVGTVKNALVDSSGNIAFVILSLGEPIAERRKEIAVPPGAFSYDHENEDFVLDVSKEELAAAPEFAISDLNDPAFAEKVYRFFGLRAPWTEGGKLDVNFDGIELPMTSSMLRVTSCELRF